MRRVIKQSGFTIVELVLLIALSSIVAVICSRILSSQLNAIQVSTNIINADTQARVALDRMTRELRNVASAGSLSATSTSKQITFVDSNNNTITYSLSGTSLLRNSDVLADNIQNLTFTYYDKSGAAISPPPTNATVYITISLVVKLQSSNFTVTTTVFMRNA